ncbi:MAG TPA: tetratricopeptide repeat protein [Bryobacteraceae bacterium]|nr:tetratricopeptide repeat protein [Bryobacteraceae bacterium]
MASLDSDRWQEVSPYLDEALALTDDQRGPWLAALRASKPELAKLVDHLLSEHRALAQEGFLEGTPLEFLQGSSLAGQSVGAYKLISPIGQGGMGTVWLAQRSDGRFERKSAIKLLNFALLGGGEEERFRREGKILAQLAHPHIAELLDAGVTSTGQPYLVLEHIEGEPIDVFCDQARLDVRARIQLFLDVLAAVAHAHANLIVHRDIKPSNVLVTKDGLVKLLDFGIAKLLDGNQAGAATLLTREAGSALTLEYAAPEQVTGAAVTTATDIYSLGVLLYLLLSRKHPAGGGPHSTAALIKTVVEVEPPRASDAARSGDPEGTGKRGTASEKLARELRGDLDTIIGKALKKNPSERYGSVQALAEDLRRYLRHEPISARPDAAGYRVGKYVRRHWIGVTLAACVALMLAAFAAVQAVQLRRITRERDRADRIAEFMTQIFKASDPNEGLGGAITAQQLLDGAAADIRKSLATDPALQGNMMHVIGRAYLYQGLNSRAQSIFEDGIKASTSAGEQESRDTLETIHDLAWVLAQEGKTAQAEKLERELLAKQKRVLGPEDMSTLATLSELGLTLCQENQCGEGAKLNQEVLEKQERVLGPEAPSTLVTMNNQAIMLAQSHRLAEAASLQQRSLEIHMRLFGERNLSTMDAMLNLGEFQRDLGRTDEAEATMRRSLDLDNRVLGPNAPETAVTTYDLATILIRKGQTAEALLLLRQSADHGLPPRLALGIEADPLLNPLHGDPRFGELVEHVKAVLTPGKPAGRKTP